MREKAKLRTGEKNSSFGSMPIFSTKIEERMLVRFQP
jgi:hypothetical protein